MLKDGLRRMVAAAAPCMWHVGTGSRLLILMYHRVLPRGDAARQFEQPGMIVAPETLEMHIRELRRHFELMPLEDWISKSAAGAPLPRLACALTFDDGWRDNHVHAFPILRAARAPATIYLVSALVGGSYGFWPTTLARILCTAWERGDRDLPARLARDCPAVSIPVAVPAHAARDTADAVIGALKAYDDQTMQRVVAGLGPANANGADRELLSWDEVHEMVESGLIRFGSHTCTHARLGTTTGIETARQEVEQSAEDLQRQLGRLVAGFCYPNGDHAPHTVELVRRRYSYAVTTQHGWNDASTDRMLLKRVGVHDDVSDTKSRLIARIAAGI